MTETEAKRSKYNGSHEEYRRALEDPTSQKSRFLHRMFDLDPQLVNSLDDHQLGEFRVWVDKHWRSLTTPETPETPFSQVLGSGDRRDCRLLDEDKVVDPEQLLEHQELGDILNRTCSILKPDEISTLEHIYGLNDTGQPMNQLEAAKEMRRTREKTRQLQAKALRKLRSPQVSQQLADEVVMEHKDGTATKLINSAVNALDSGYALAADQRISMADLAHDASIPVGTIYFSEARAVNTLMNKGVNPLLLSDPQLEEVVARYLAEYFESQVDRSLTARNCAQRLRVTATIADLKRQTKRAVENFLAGVVKK